MIEIEIKRIADALETITTKLEALVGGAPPKTSPKKTDPVGDEEEAPKKAAKKAPKKKSSHTSASLTKSGKELIKLSDIKTLRSVLDDVLGKGVKISEAPEDKFDDVHEALTAKIEELKSGKEEEEEEI